MKFASNLGYRTFKKLGANSYFMTYNNIFVLI